MRLSETSGERGGERRARVSPRAKLIQSMKVLRVVIDCALILDDKKVRGNQTLLAQNLRRGIVRGFKAREWSDTGDFLYAGSKERESVEVFACRRSIIANDVR